MSQVAPEHCITVLNAPMHNLTQQQTLALIRERIQNKQFTQHTVVNVAKVVAMRNDPELRHSVTSSDIINIDGMGVVWGARFLGKNVTERVAGIDLFHALLKVAAEAGYPVYLLGAKADVVQKTAEVVQQQNPGLKIAGYQHGYFWDQEAETVEAIRQSGAKLLFVAMSSPLKENFINRWQTQLGVDFVMGVGGTFDVVAGKVKRAPVWMQNAGLEWFYRFIQEPKRMWRRAVVDNIKFAALLLKERLSIG